MEKLTQVGMWNDGTIKWLKWYRLNQYLHVSSVWAILHRDRQLSIRYSLVCAGVVAPTM